MAKIRPSHAGNFDPAILKLAVAFAGSFIIYILAFILPANLLKLYGIVRLDSVFLQNGGFLSYLRMVLAFFGVGVLYFWGMCIARQAKTRAAWIVVIGGTLVFVLVFLFMVPFDALDIYDNIFHGRITGIYASNPFSQMIAAYPRDPFFNFTPWKSSPSAYGPLWETLAGLTARLAGNGILQNVLAFKLLAGIFQLAGVAVLVVYFRRTAPDRALPAALLLGWNPVVLYEAWGNGHNDFAMAFWVLLAAVLIARKHYTWAVLSLVAGALVKFIPLLLIPTVLLLGVRNLQKWRPRLWFLGRTIGAALVLIVVAYLPFWTGIASLNISRRMQMFTTSLPAVIYRFLQPVIGISLSASVVSLVTLGVLAGFVLVQSFQVRENDASRDFTSIAFYILAFYLLITCLWFQQWYGLWLVALAPLLPGRDRNLALLFGFWVLTKQFVFGPVIVPQMTLYLDRALWLEPLLTLSILGLPWALALYNIRLSRRSIGTSNVLPVMDQGDDKQEC